MIGFISGRVLFSDGKESIIQDESGVGHQIYCHYILPESSKASLYVSHIIREAAQDLYGFRSLRDKKMFEMLLGVKGVGPKSSYVLVTMFGTDNIVRSVQFEDKKELSKAPGVGPKSASQIILDLSKKITRVYMYSQDGEHPFNVDHSSSEGKEEQETGSRDTGGILHEALLACRELGLKQEEVLGSAQRILNNNEITKSEQLVHLVLKELA